MKRKPSWREKLADSKDLPKVQPITEKMSRRWGTGTVAIPAPTEVDQIMQRVPKGKLITINEIRQIVARNHRATIGCPITTGIFAWIAAHAAEEELSEGRKRITPYWRTLKSGGIERQRARLESEGHNVIAKGKKLIVDAYERSLARL